MKRLKAITIFVTLFFLFACKSEKKERIVNFDPAKKIDLDSVPELIKKPDSLLFWKQRYQSDSVKIKVDSMQPSFAKHFLDRFNPKHTIKNKLFQGVDRLIHFRWTFSYTTATNN